MKESTSRARELYDRYRFGTFDYGRKRDAFEPLLFEALAGVSATTTLYDLGCGTGYWLDAYLDAGVRQDRIVCLDLARSNLVPLRARGFAAVAGDVLHLPIADRSSDLTICLGVIHHTDDPRHAFREAVRITRPGGRIYLNVYNRWHPYYYIVHRATAPLRYVYWNHTRRIADVAYRVARIAFQPLALLVLGRFLDDETGRTMFMDQVMTPRAALFTKGKLRAYARDCGCTVESFRYNRFGLMLSALVRVS